MVFRSVAQLPYKATSLKSPASRAPPPRLSTQINRDFVLRYPTLSETAGRQSLVRQASGLPPCAPDSLFSDLTPKLS
jgi:hypothetical protein